ncbi:MAG TPA: branched-chain amino acid ABC transporter permease [Candidatus Binatia bacterium]|nr:branched-chain amino acid ABC transporter permease [Candidatus Binatia bacterium]
MAAIGAALAAAPLILGPYYRSLLLAILADVALAVAWAFFSGPTRYLSLATGAFFGAGAYASALLGARMIWPLPVLAGAAVAAAMAVVVGALALRMRGPYFAVFTFGLAELAKHGLIWYETSVTGTVGRLLLNPPGPVALYYTALGVTALAVATSVRLRRSSWGHALIGIGADEERAQTLGIDTVRVKVATFAGSAAFMGAIGATMAPRWTYLDPQVFNPLISFQTVIMALLGGAGTVAGPILGAVFLGLASEILLLRFRYLYLLGLGLTLIVVALAMPSGLAGLMDSRRRRPPALRNATD